MVDYLNRVDISKVINEQLSIRIRRKLKFVSLANDTFIWEFRLLLSNKGNNKITELRTILQRESQNS
jgi:hypothetical protein